MTEQQQIALLLHKYLLGSLTETETLLLENWKGKSEANRQFFDALQNEDQLSRWIAEDHPDQLKETEERIYAKVLHRIPALRIVPLYRRSWFRVAAAASVFFMAGLTWWLSFSTKQPGETTDEVVQVQKVNDIEAPKAAKATITLANGTTVPVDSLTAITQNNVQLSKVADGKIVYSGSADEVMYNTLTNPRGSQVIDMILSDGTHVWLNTGSSLTYPVAFTGNERKVTITGEAYFEVASSSSPAGGGKRSFLVSKGDVEIKVLGTHFNVNAYDDETDIKVTLLEGSVKVSNSNSEGLLQPGQQAQVSSGIKVIDAADIEQAMAWKDGSFYFNNTDIKTIMRQVSRWYDVEIVYEGEPVETLLGGIVSRKENISQLLKILEATGKAHFIIEGKKIITTR
jgi:ferric-dicitrate binding protein FerR (iron transport regulator)